MPDVSAPPTLMTLADDMIVDICLKAGPRAAARLSCVSREMDRLAGHEHVWTPFHQTYIDPRPPAPHDAGRAGFARRVPDAGRCLAAKACLGDLRGGSTLVAFPEDNDTPRFCIQALALEAAITGRPFRLLSAAAVHSASDLAGLEPDEVCVFEHVEVVSARSANLVGALLGAAPQDGDAPPADDRKIVLLHAADLDTCDAGLLRRVSRQVTFCPVPPVLPIDPYPAVSVV